MAAATIFSSTLQKLRKEKGVTQEQLANHLGVSPQAVSKWENGSYPEGDLLPRISEFFGVSISYLYGQETGEVSIEQAVLNVFTEMMDKHSAEKLSGSYHPEYFEKMLDIVWAFQLGAWKNNKEYWKRTESDPDFRTASLLSDDAGFSYLNLNRDREFLAIVREPEDGFAANIKITEKIRKFFEILGTLGALEILFFVMTLKPYEYVTIDTIAKNTGLKTEDVSKLLADLGSLMEHKPNPPFFAIDVVGTDSSRKAYSINGSVVCNYITLMLVADSLTNSVSGYQMQINSREKSFFEREKVLEMIRDMRGNGEKI